MAVSEPVKIQCAGAYSGILTLPSLEVAGSVAQARQLISGRIGEGNSACVKLIAGGRTLEDDAKALTDYGVHSKTRLLVMRTARAAASAKLAAQESRAQRLARLKDAAAAVAARGDGSSWNDGAHEFALENQDGEGLRFDDPQDRKALVMGLALHEQGKQLLEKEDYQEALDVLLLAEEAFEMCNPKHLDMVDNVGLLMIDIVWCYFQLRAIGQLAAGRARLDKAQGSLQRSHGPSGVRMRRLHGNFCPELAIYVRLDLLQGVAAFHSGDSKASLHLASALSKWRRLQVSDESLATLASMGFTASQATRALRFCEGDTEQAASFAADQAQLTKKRKADHTEQKKLRREMRSYGATASGKLVDAAGLQLLESMGFQRALAAEALKQSDNEGQAALDALADPKRAEQLQLAVYLTSATNTSPDDNPDPAALDTLINMGFNRDLATRALQQCHDDQAKALDTLVSWGQAARAASSSSFGDVSSQNGEAIGAAGSSVTGAPVRQTAADAASLLAQALQSSKSGADEAELTPPADESQEEGRDAEAEAELAAVVKDDPLAAYDVDVRQEGLAIQEYLMLLQQQQKH
ncbi:TPA: hypothetical protein ACH3X2_007006 [Trebouxia sp. C0005]|nr:MAG: hypothetical protein FRX49_01202 [Trebouxia sp. A1-2]